MQQNRKGIYNIFFGLLGQLIMICLGIIIPRLVLVQYGSEINGLLNSVNQIITYISLLEAGVGTASIQALYKPIAQSDTNQINCILSATNKYYQKTGCIYFLFIIVIAILYPITIKTELSNTTIFFVFLFTGMSGVINFWFQGKYRLYLEAEGKNYILISINTIIYILQSLLKVVLLLNGFSVVVVQAACFVVNLLPIIIILYYIRTRYSWIDMKAMPDYQAISQKNSVLIHQISTMIFNNTDVLLLSIFCGLRVVSIYSMYSLVINYVISLVNQVNSGFKFKMGQLYAIDRKAYLKIHNMFEVVNMILVFSCFTLVYILILPFMKLYTAGTVDINYIDTKLPLLFVMIQLLSNGRASSNYLISYAGHFKNTQWRSVLESIINIVVSVVGVQFFGIYGVLLGTITALLYRANDMIIYSHRYILHDSPLKTYRRWILSFFSFIISILFLKKIPVEFDSYGKIFFFGSSYMILILIIHISVQGIFERKVYNDYLEYIKKIIRRKYEQKK